MPFSRSPNGVTMTGIRCLTGPCGLKIAAHAHPNNAHRMAWYAEVALLALTGAAIAALVVTWVELESLLSPRESPILVRARLMRGIFSLAVPLTILLFLPTLRVGIAALLKKQNANPATLKSAKYMWFLVMAFIIIILTLDTFVIVNSFQDIDFN